MTRGLDTSRSAVTDAEAAIARIRAKKSFREITLREFLADNPKVAAEAKEVMRKRMKPPTAK